MMLHEYFSHDYAARSNPKIQYLIADLGTNGYGCFWSLIEELYKQSNRLFVKDIKRLAKVFNAPLKKLTRVVYDYGLFSFTKNEDGEDVFYSEGVEERLAMREEAAKGKMGKRSENEGDESISDKRRRAVMTRWAKKNGAAIQNTSVSIQNTSVSACIDTNGIQTDTNGIQNTPQNKKNKEKSNSSLTTTTSSPIQTEDLYEGGQGVQEDETPATATPAERPQETPTPLPPSRTADDIAGEVRELMRDENVRYQLRQKSGGMEMAYISAFIPEFAGQLALQRNTETGVKLAMHFGYWLGRKNEVVKKQSKNNDEREKQKQHHLGVRVGLAARMLGDEAPEWMQGTNYGANIIGG